MSSYVLYRDVAPMAEDDAAVTATGAAEFSEVSMLPHGGVDPGRVMSCELNQWVLDGMHTLAETASFVLWSEELSGADCIFQIPPVVDILFTQKHTSLGLTFIFDEAEGNYCSRVNVKWYRDAELLADQDFYPDGPQYFVNRRVEAYSRVVITLLESSLPHRRAKLNQVMFGLLRQYDMSSLRSAKITNQTDVAALELPVSTLDIQLDSRDPLEFMFQLKQPMEAWNNGTLLGVYYIDEHTRMAQRLYRISCYDALGVLDESPFAGGHYSNVSAVAILKSILEPEFTLLVDGVADVQLTGVILADTRRAALQQVLFAAGWVCSTDGGYEIRVFCVNDLLKEVGRNRTYTGVTASIASVVTEVRVTAHSYAVSLNGPVEINGTKYSDTETVYSVFNPLVTANDKQNIIEIRNATLVSNAIGQEVAQRVYDYYAMRQTDRAKIVWAGERLGDYVSLPAAWGTSHAGYIQKMTITLSNTVAADLETVGPM